MPLQAARVHMHMRTFVYEVCLPRLCGPRYVAAFFFRWRHSKSPLGLSLVEETELLL